MRVLLDTHVALWWLKGDNRIPRRIRDIVAHPDTEAFVSAATIWEIAIKSKLGKLPAAAAAVETMPACFTDIGFSMLAINAAHAKRAGNLPLHHRDPFDRMLVAQAAIESLTLISGDPVLSLYDVDTGWDAIR
ncbi:MAG: type II toxin-antitoxin system VapC family toxin [Rhodospirillaceae bacterium]|nr:type II toxin-antitoxin system VapC family toxin [Rhodospirillaceae bacterium]MYH39248.1 type II toxin-antitoxin system VapC family toxin [Rhodospirillaceae bacterium]MYK16122.1 type II toxin-antitoxin system VapC family toxin [Rhodospirillaceae bacterium]MYK58863.1 type II toxin-antitoxin system VapC family toxin [Rhodospirillaceae bacterium]